LTNPLICVRWSTSKEEKKKLQEDNQLLTSKETTQHEKADEPNLTDRSNKTIKTLTKNHTNDLRED